MDIKSKDGLLLKLKRALLMGVLFSAIVTSLWFLFQKSGIKRIVAVILGAAVIIFVFKLIFDFVIDKIQLKRRLIANCLFVLFAVVAFFLTTICVLAPAMLYRPSINKEAHGKLADYSDVEEIVIETTNGTYSGWLLHNVSGNAPLVLYYGGNSDNSSARMMWFKENVKGLEAFSGCNFAFVDYPGYGSSDGSPSDESLKSFGLSVYDYFAQRSDVNRIIIMGYSLGTGVSNYVASQREPAGLVLMAPYANGYDLYNNKLNIFYGPMRLLVTYKMRADRFAQTVGVKPLILASKIDELVPYESSVKLFQSYNNGCDFVTVNISHGEFWDNEEVMSKIRDYIADVK